MAGAALGAPPARFAWEVQHLEHLSLMLHGRCSTWIHHHQHNTISTTSQHNLINTASLAHHHLHNNTTCTTPATQHHLHYIFKHTINNTAPSQHHQHNLINTTSSTHHHLHTTIYTTPSTLRHEIHIAILVRQIWRRCLFEKGDWLPHLRIRQKCEHLCQGLHVNTSP